MSQKNIFDQIILCSLTDESSIFTAFHRCTSTDLFSSYDIVTYYRFSKVVTVFQQISYLPAKCMLTFSYICLIFFKIISNQGDSNVRLATVAWHGIVHYEAIISLHAKLISYSAL